MLLGPRVLHYPPCPQPGGVSLFEISDVSHTGSLSTPLSESKGRGPCPRYRTFLITPLSSFRKGVLVRCLDSHEALSSFSYLFFNKVTSSAIFFFFFTRSYPRIPCFLTRSPPPPLFLTRSYPLMVSFPLPCPNPRGGVPVRNRTSLFSVVISSPLKLIRKLSEMSTGFYVLNIR
jgi:hypothetical protein